jgi:copper transport protein
MKKSNWFSGLALLALAAAAQAHTHLKEAVPANGSTVKTSPPNIMLTFTQAARVTALTIQKEGGSEQKLEPLPKEAAAHVMVPAPKLEPGKYTVTYRVLSADNHVMSGKVQFTVGDGKSAAAPATDAAHSHEGH